MFERALQLLEIDPELGGVIACGFRPAGPVAGRRIPPHGALSGYRTPWGFQPGLLDGAGRFVADLDLLPPESQRVLTQRMDQGGCTLAAWAAEPVWAHLAERVAFLIPPGVAWTPVDRGRVLSLGQAIRMISTAAQAMGVEGHRAEWFALRAAQAAAKAAGRRRLTEGDVAEAVALVLAPRARTSPAQEAPSEAQQQPRPAPEEQAEAPPLQVPLIPLPPPAPVALKPSLHGAPVRSVPGRRRRGSLDLAATLLAALPWQRVRGRTALPPAIRPQDLRWLLRRPRLGRLVIFVVDASGSMGARRLGQAKGAVLSLLQQAYRERDQVALITAAGREPRLALPPARAVEQARRRLLPLPAGGATPLVGALAIALDLAMRAQRREGRPSTLILLSDGRANLPHRAPDRSAVREELRRVCLALRPHLSSPVVAGQAAPEAVEVARWLNASFQPLSRIR